MESRHNTSGLVETRSEVLAKYEGWSFPNPITNTVIESLGYTTVFEGPQPSFTTIGSSPQNTVTNPYQSAVRDGIEQKDGKWYTKYKIETATGDAATAIDNNVAATVRIERNRKLHDSDWTQAADTALASDKKAAWATYRTSLRNLPSASGFPHTHVWPTEPS